MPYRMPTEHIRNPQTEALLEMLQLPYNLDHSQQADFGAAAAAGPSSYSAEADRQQRLLSGRGAGTTAVSAAGPQQLSEALPPPPARTVTEAQVAAALANPEEIDLSEGGDDDGGDDDGGMCDDEDGMHELREHEKAKEGQAAAAEHIDDDPMFQPL